MIKHEIGFNVTKNRVYVKAGDGDIAFGGAMSDDGKSYFVTVNELDGKHEIGESVSLNDVKDSPLVIEFSSPDDIENLICFLEDSLAEFYNAVDSGNETDDIQTFENRDCLNQDFENDESLFLVPIKNIFVASTFKGTFPDSGELFECFEHYRKHGGVSQKYPIEVQQNMILTGGYTQYCFSKSQDETNVTVKAKDGIVVNFDDDHKLVFHDNLAKVRFFDGNFMGNKKYCLVIKNSGNSVTLFVDTKYEAIAFLQKIRDMFFASFEVICYGEADFVEELKEAGFYVVFSRNYDMEK